VREQIRWSFALWLAILAFDFFFFLTFVVILDTRGAILLIATIIVLTLLAFQSSRLVIQVTDTQLRVGRAHIDRKFISEIEILDKNAMRIARTRDINPAAYLNLRFWVPTGVRITINDASDPTPYWLISSRRNKELAEKLASKK
jgi:hypothetical protein